MGMRTSNITENRPMGQNRDKNQGRDIDIGTALTTVGPPIANGSRSGASDTPMHVPTELDMSPSGPISTAPSELNDLARVISEDVRYFRDATWEITIDQADESSRNLNQVCRQLTKVTPPIYPTNTVTMMLKFEQR
ncbi:hypothetical protein EVAR_19229_1 [Eumeta japonica]|uniref:Uncharacterized protein n=1 Tax=Eumeta variegata TaxID=151549 RepID=A0A4C1VEW9_EUMVA|nr:hypothetical protein EVAR_19229_1 [Eumeta japonica]